MPQILEIVRRGALLRGRERESELDDFRVDRDIFAALLYSGVYHLAVGRVGSESVLLRESVNTVVVI